jgi:prefoldin subunit 5
LSLKANQADTDLAFSLTDGQIDAVNALLGTKANQVDMENAAALISVLDTDLTDNVVRIDNIESNISILHSNIDTIESNISILHSNIDTIESNISILHSNIDIIESNISILHSNINTIESNISILHSNIDNIESNISILYGNLETLTYDFSSNASRTSVLESSIYYTYEDGVDEDDDPITLSGNVSTLHTFVESLETDLASNTERIAAIEGDHVTNADLASKQAIIIPQVRRNGNIFRRPLLRSIVNKRWDTSKVPAPLLEAVAAIHAQRSVPPIASDGPPPRILQLRKQVPHLWLVLGGDCLRTESL